MARYLTKRLFKPRRGIDLKSSENNRSEDYLTNAQNVMYDSNGNLCKRNGYQLRVYGADAASGLVQFDTTDYVGNSKSELILLGNSSTSSPLRVVKNTLTITNTRIDSSVTFSVYYDEVTLQYRMALTGAETANIAMGLGVGDLTIAGLIAALPLTQTGVASGDDTVPSAFIGIKQVTIQPGDSESFEYYTTEEITWGGHGSEPSTTVVSPTENPSYAIVNGCLYWYRNQDSADKKLYKYDGHTWYEAGLNTGDYVSRDFTNAANGATVTDCKGTHTLYYPDPYNDTEINNYCFRWAFKDKIGFIHTGGMSDVYTGSTSIARANGGGPIFILNPFTDVSMARYLVNTGHNARSAIVDAGGAAYLDDVTTITVNAGHTLSPGDVAYFWRKIGSGGFFIERLIESVTPTSITISTDKITDLDYTDTVDVYDNAIISNNFRIEYFRASEYDSESNVISAEIVASVPFNSLGSNGVQFNDIYVNTLTNTRDAYRYADGLYQLSGANPYPPPNGKFVSQTSNGSTLIVAGDPESNNTVYSSTPEDCEAFYIGRNSFTVDEPVTALGSSGSVAIVGTKNKTYAVTGDIPSLNFRVEKITDNLGIRGHSTVAEVDEGVIAFNTIRGTFSLAGGRELRPVGEWPVDKRISIIEPFFTYRYPQTTYAPNFDVASVSVVKEKKLIFNSCPSYYGSTFGANDNLTWVYDYSMGGWFVWFGVDMSFGSAYWDDKVWCAGHSPGGGVDLFTMNETNSDYDYSDHGSAIDAVIQYHWEAAGDSNLYKKFQWLTIYTPPGNGLPYNLVVKSYANYEISKSTCFVNPTAIHTSFEKYATPPAYTVEAKLKSGKMCSMLLEIANDSANEGMWIGGTELDIAPVFQTPSRSGRSDS